MISGKRAGGPRALPGLAALLAVVLGGAPLARPGEPAAPPATPTAAPQAPTLEEIYAGYKPDFIDWGWVGRGGRLPLSLQPYYNNMAYVDHDFRVDGIIKTAVEKETRGEYRDAMRLYQEIIDKFTDDLWPISNQGIFVPSALYAHRRLLAMPKRELAYYRTLKDAEARQLFQRAAKYNSLPDYAEVVERYLATSWGDDALFALGNAAMDEGKYELARHYFEQIVKYEPASDVDRQGLQLKLAESYKKLGDEEKYRAARAEMLAGKGPLPADLLRKRAAELDGYQPPARAFFEQRRNPDYISMNDYTMLPEPESALSAKSFVWHKPLPHAKNDQVSFTLPWVVDNRILYRYKNALFACSLLTGEEKWRFVPGGFLDWFDSEIDVSVHGHGVDWRFYPDQDLLVHDGLVFSSVYKGGPNLVAVDVLTGQLRWAAGPMAATSERDQHTRYLCLPTAGPNCIYAPYVYDEMEGGTQLSSEAGITCFDSRTGKILWQRRLVRLSPRKFTISKVERKIRIYSSPPALVDGVLYHTTNCGLLAAVDALSGTVRWATRYPHAEMVHDTEEKPGHLWANRAPIVKDGRVYVTPVDSHLIYCASAENGRMLWSQNNDQGKRTDDNRNLWGPKGLVGMNSEGNLVVQTADNVGCLDAKTGTAKWAYAALWPHPDRGPRAQRTSSRATLTAGNRVHLTGVQGWPHWAWSQSCVDALTGKQIAERWYFSPEYLAVMPPSYHGPPRTQVFNTEEPFVATNRMAFPKHGTIFEIEVSSNRLYVKYDPEKVRATASADDRPQSLFVRGELLIMAGRQKEAIAVMESGRAGLALEEARFRAEINQQLFKLYERQAQAAMQLGNLAESEKYCGRMATACTTGEDEIKVILGTAEIYEKQKRYDQAAQCLAAAIRHYEPVRYGVPSLLLSDQDILKAKGHELIGNLVTKKPQRYFDKEVEHALKCMDVSLENYFSIISPVEADMRVETGQFASQWMQRLLKGPAAGQAEKFNRQAAEAFKSQNDEQSLLRLIREYPATRAAQATLDGLIAKARQAPEPERHIRLWQCHDQGLVNGLNVPADVAQLAEIRIRREPAAALQPPYGAEACQIDVDPNTLLCLLPRKGERAGGESLLFMGLRSKRAHGLKFGLICWDAAAGRKLWQTDELRLEGAGETGFEECFLRAGKVVVHGRSEVKAFNLADGKPAWQFHAPFNFEIEYAASVEDLLILCGRDRTLAIHHANGQLVWEANEAGLPYCEPLLRDNVLILTRANPSGVTFRSLGTGRLLAQQDLPELLPNRAHPVLPRGGEETPWSFDGEALLLTDGWDYIVVDTAGRKVKWQRRIEDVDRFSPLPLPFRLRISGNELLGLKQQFDTPVAEMFDTQTGAPLWKKIEEKKEGVIYSAVFDAKNIYGIHYEPELRSVTLLGLERRSGRQELSWTRGNYEAPEVFLDPEMHGRHLVVTVKDKNKFQLLLVHADSKSLEGELAADGSGAFGNYGEVSYVVQDRFLGLLSGTKLLVARPKK